MGLNFAFHSLRIKYQPSEGSMMIDLATIQSLELIQNIQNSKSKNCLFGLMNETLTPMGSRLLRSSILQPSTQADVLAQRYDAVEELSNKEDLFFQTRQGGWFFSFGVLVLTTKGSPESYLRCGETPYKCEQHFTEQYYVVLKFATVDHRSNSTGYPLF